MASQSMQVANPTSAAWARPIVDLVVSFVMPHGPGQKTIPLELIEKLPKTDLHVHLDGSLRLATILELAASSTIELPARDADGLRGAMNLGQNCGSLVEYLKAFDVTLRVMQTEEALTRVAYELAEDAARENVRYMEVRYSPMLHTRRGLKLTSVVEACSRGSAPRRTSSASSRTSSSAASATSRPSPRSRWPSSRSPTRAAASSASTSPAPSTTTRPSTTRRRSSSSATTTSTSPSTRARRTGPSRSRRRSTSAARTASATAAACARTATCSTTSTTTASRSSAARRPTCRPAPSATSRATRSSSTSTSACA